MQVTKLNWGLSRWLNDELQVELYPHAWLPKTKGKTIRIEKLLPDALINQYTYSQGVLTHNAYLKDDNVTNHPHN